MKLFVRLCCCVLFCLPWGGGAIKRCVCGRGGRQKSVCNCDDSLQNKALGWDGNFCGGADEWSVHAFTNSEREKYRLSPVICNKVLTDVARQYSELMCNTGCTGHSCSGLTFGYRLERSGYQLYIPSVRSVTTGAENLYYSADTPQGAVQTWMASDGHRKNILNPDFSEMGVGVVHCARDGNTYWTQIFGWPNKDPEWGLQYYV